MNLADSVLSVSVPTTNALNEWKTANGPKTIEAFQEATEVLARAWSGSWLGYQSRIYTVDLVPPGPGAYFDGELGQGRNSSEGEANIWKEWDGDAIKSTISEISETSLQLSVLMEYAPPIATAADAMVIQLESILSIAISSQPTDTFIKRTAERLESLEYSSANKILAARTPKGGVVSQDYRAALGGITAAPHIEVQCQLTALRSIIWFAECVINLAASLSAHLNRLNMTDAISKHSGTRVFIGHGRSPIWRELKDFVVNRLGLEHIEFNSHSTAGIATTERLTSMLDQSSFALLVLTAEDQTADGKMQARMNVVHEVGLFQGRLGFRHAIVLLEDGCEDFSNIAGLTQIRFPKGDIAARFENVRRVIERENLC